MTPTSYPPPLELNGAISYGQIFAIVIVVAIIGIVIVGGALLIITAMRRKS